MIMGTVRKMEILFLTNKSKSCSVNYFMYDIKISSLKGLFYLLTNLIFSNIENETVYNKWIVLLLTFR